MNPKNSLTALAKRLNRGNKTTREGKRLAPRIQRVRLTVRPVLESLEDRVVPAINIAPGDVTALIQAIDQANTTPSAPNVIDLAPGSTYVLSTPDNYWYGPNGLPPIARPGVDGS